MCMSSNPSNADVFYKQTKSLIGANMNREPKKIISTEMLTDIICIQQASLLCLQAEIQMLEAQIDLGQEVKGVRLFPKVEAILHEFEHKHKTNYYDVVSALLNIDELHKYLYEHEVT